jgi:hypothetical protein
MEWIEVIEAVIPTAAPTAAALLGTWFGVRAGISKLRGEMAFIRRLDWYQTASEASLQLRYTLQEVIKILRSESESIRGALQQPWEELLASLDAFLEVVPQSHLFARAPTYRKLRRFPVVARELVSAFPQGPEHPSLEEWDTALDEFKKEVSLITGTLTDDLRDHLGLKALSARRGLREWFVGRKARWSNDRQTG